METKEEVLKRWESLGMVEGLSGTLSEKLADLYRSKAQELPISELPTINDFSLAKQVIDKLEQ